MARGVKLKSTYLIAELSCWCGGILLCGFFLFQVYQGEVKRVEDLERVGLVWRVNPPDMSLWSESRIEAWKATQGTDIDDILAVLDAPHLSLQVPVYASASDFDMDRGAGWIPGTARPDEVGNIGIAGHRDGYFRALKDAQLGDALRLRTPQGVERYIIEDISIVDPVDVDVLAPTEEKTLTLVTCYPFYFVGSAPQRYIIRAQRIGLDSRETSTTFTNSI